MTTPRIKRITVTVEYDDPNPGMPQINTWFWEATEKRPLEFQFQFEGQAKAAFHYKFQVRGAIQCCERDFDKDGNCDRHPKTKDTPVFEINRDIYSSAHKKIQILLHRLGPYPKHLDLTLEDEERFEKEIVNDEIDHISFTKQLRTEVKQKGIRYALPYVYGLEIHYGAAETKVY